MTSRPARLTPPSELFDGWGSKQLDLDAYRDRIDFGEPLRPDLDTLRGICRAQVTHVPFENLEIVLGRDVPLDLESLQRKMIHNRRGGYCYEANSLLAAVLETAGFDFTASLARVRMGSGVLRPTSHANLIVRLDDGEEWLADAGFGGHGLLEPIRISDGSQAVQGGWTFRLDHADERDWILSRADGADWIDLYSFTLEPRYPVDFATANYFTSTNPRSPFTGRLLAQTTGAEVRRELVDTQLTVFAAGAEPQATQLEPADLPAVLAEQFGIALSETDAADVVRTVAGWTAG